MITGRNFWIAKLLGPEAFGIYSLTIVLQQQFSFFGLGVREAVSLELAAVGNNKKNFKKWVQSAFGFCITVFAFLSLLAIILSYYTPDFLSAYPTIFFAFKLAAVSIGVEIFANVTRATETCEV